MQIRCLQEEIGGLCEQLRSRGLSAKLLLGGDFNAMREELLHGNGDAFFGCAAVAATQPPWKKPISGSEVTAASAGAASCRMADDGSGALELLCPQADGGALREVSQPDAAMAVGCTRAGKSIVIDFIFCGSVGCEAELCGGGAEQWASTREAVSAEQVRRAADASSGIYANVLEFGSDHLPVACELRL